MQIVSLVIGIIALFYFVMLAIFVGLTNLFTYFWLLLGGIFVTYNVFYNRICSVWGNLLAGIRILFVSILSLGIIVVGISMGILIKNGVNKPKSGADYVIVLGAQVRGKSPSNNLIRRLDKTIEYINGQGKKDTKIIVSGGKGNGEEISEAKAMKEYLLKKGISEDCIIVEDKSKNTYENIKYSKKIMADDNAKIVIVTNDFHVFRGVSIAKKQGLKNVEGCGSTTTWYTVPNLYLREAFAVIKYYICGQI